MKKNQNDTRRRGRPSLSEGEAALKNLYHVAFTHFFLNGIEGANMQLIAKEAGVSRQMIHNRFGSKEQFFEQVLEHGQSHLMQKFIYQGKENANDPWLFFMGLGEQMYATFTDPDSVSSFRMLDLAIYRHADLAELHNRSIDEAYKRFGKILRDMAKEYGLDIKVGKSAIRDFIALIRGYAQPVIQGVDKVPTKSSQKKEIKEIVSRYLRGLGFGEPPL